jgi:hypothetical protein
MNHIKYIRLNLYVLKRNSEKIENHLIPMGRKKPAPAVVAAPHVGSLQLRCAMGRQMQPAEAPRHPTAEI